MAAFSAREDEGHGVAPIVQREAVSLDEIPTVVASNPHAAAVAAETPAVLEVPDALGATETAPEPAHPAGGDGASSGGEVVVPPAPPEALSQDRTVISKRPPLADLRFDQPHTPQELGQALVGKQLAHVQLEEFLGGGMGAVFRGRDLTLGRNVAIKVLARGQDEDTIRRFQNEAQSSARLNHEHIARVYYIGEEDGYHFIIFEHIEGVTIRQRVLECGPLSLHEAFGHTLQVAEALDHAFRRDVVHRDIKPSNLIISTEGVTKLVDMGLARLHQVEASKNDLTASGVTLGTFDYISPEQARDPRSADVRSDLYSLGCTLYFMLAGRPPFPEGTVLQKLLDHQSRQPPDLRVFRPDLPEEAAAVVNRLLAKLPENRYPTPRALIDDLTALAERWDMAVDRRPPRGAVASPARDDVWREHLVWLAPTALLIVAVLAGEWWWRTPSGGVADAFPQVVMPHAMRPSESTDGGELSAQPTHLADGPAPAATTAGEERGAGGGTALPTLPLNADSAAGSGNLAASGAPRAAPRGDTPSPKVSGGDPQANAATPRGTSERRANEKPAPPAPVTARGSTTPPLQADLVRTVAVGSQVSLAADEAWVETADEALRMASLNAWPELETIELRFNGVQAVRPFAVARSHLTIRAGQGYTPVLAFESGASYPLDKHMIYVQGREVGGGGLTLEGVQIRWRVLDRTPRDWALFLLDDVSSIRLRGCVLTIQNVGSDGFSHKNGAAFFRLASSTINRRAMQLTPPPPPPEIILHECIARGEADLVAASEVEPFDLAWSQGVLATTERLADLGGAALERMGSIRIELDHVTAVADAGLCRLSANDRTPYQLHLHIQSDNCLFSTQADAPLVEHDTQDRVDDLANSAAWGRLLSWTGENNARIRGQVAWRIDDAVAQRVEFVPTDVVWVTVASEDSFADYEIAWRNPPAPDGWLVEAHDRTAESYAIDVRRTPVAFYAETPGAILGSLPPIARDVTKR